MPARKDDGDAKGFSSEELGAYWTVVRSMFRRGALNRSSLELIGRTALDGFNRAGGVSGLRSMLSEGVRSFEPESRPRAAGRPGPRPSATAALPAKAEPISSPDLLAGTALVPGRAEGTARVLAGAEAPREVGADEVLVCARIEPGWMHAISGAAAIVVETGAPATRTIQFARQRQLPTVRLAGATGLVADGARVGVDGESGAVLLLGDAA